MYVDKNYRNFGLGRQLIERVLEKAISLGYEEIILETVPSMVAEILLYEKYGFRKVENNVAVSPRCDIIMSKNLK